jgi:hypothetical protein
MTKKLDDLFNLPDFIDEAEILEEITEMDTKELMDQSTLMLDSISNTEKIDSALTVVSGISSHDLEMNDIASKAMKSYQDLMTLGMNVSDAHAGRVFEGANMMLETALKANDAKVSRKLKTIELQLKKARLDHDMNVVSGKSNDEESGMVFDRNELLRIINDNKAK